METKAKVSITVETTVNSPVQKVWEYWTAPEHITRWNSASEDWHSPHAKNDLRIGGSFLARMESKDGSVGFDFEGVYNEVKPNEKLAYTLGDGRKVSIVFSPSGNKTNIVETFDAESTNSIDRQKEGWQAILNNFKKYTESKS
jgi:uncharacterized protein YndB with AHSA1/START domain